MLARDDAIHDAGEGRVDVDRRIASAGRDAAVEHDVPVEDAAHLVGHGLVEVPALDEDGVDGGDAAARSLAGALEEARQSGEGARRVAAAGGRLSGGEAHLAGGTGEARHRVDEQQHARAAIAEVLGVGGGHLRRPHPLEGRDVARRHDGDAPCASGLAEAALQELRGLAAALPDERDDDDVGLGSGGNRCEQGALADP